MPINDIVAEVSGRGASSPIQTGGAPEVDNAPSGDPAPTTMNNGRGLPPYLHNQTLGNRSALTLLGTVLGLIGLVRQVRG